MGCFRGIGSAGLAGERSRRRCPVKGLPRASVPRRGRETSASRPLGARRAGRSIAAAAATITAATAAATAAVTTAARTGFAGLGFVNGEVPAVVLAGVEPLDGRLRLGVGGHLDEPEPLGAVRVAIDDDLRTLDR